MANDEREHKFIEPLIDHVDHVDRVSIDADSVSGAAEMVDAGKVDGRLDTNRSRPDGYDPSPSL